MCTGKFHSHIDVIKIELQEMEWRREYIKIENMKVHKDFNQEITDVIDNLLLVMEYNNITEYYQIHKEFCGAFMYAKQL